MIAKIKSIRIQGYRPFKDCLATFGDLEVFVGANGSGKSSLFEFLRFLREALKQDIPPEIIEGSIGQQIFHFPGPERFSWNVEVDFGQSRPLTYQGQLMGPVGRTHITSEKVETVPARGFDKGFIFMDLHGRKGVISDPIEKKFKDQTIEVSRPNQLALSMMNSPAVYGFTLYNLREFISNWRFYSSFIINNALLRTVVPVEQEPQLREDAGNLSSVLLFLKLEHGKIFNEIEVHLRSAVPGFKRLNLKTVGKGNVMAYWEEERVDQPLSLADLSDGILRFLCWTVLCLHPNPPSLLCIDEPDQGVHPRTLAILAGLFEKLSQRTQVFLATHSSYFLSQVTLDKIAVFRKVNGEARYFKPYDSKVLIENLKEFGTAEIERLHQNDELESFSVEVK